MTDNEAMNVASQCRVTASADLCKNILVDGGSGFLFELLLDAAKAIETLAQETALQTLHDENERLGLYKDAYGQPEQEPVAWQWLGSAHFRKKLPKNADVTAWNPLYSAPQRSWVGLSEKKQWEIARNISCFDWGELMSETEQALKELNT